MELPLLEIFFDSSLLSFRLQIPHPFAPPFRILPLQFVVRANRPILQTSRVHLLLLTPRIIYVDLLRSPQQRELSSRLLTTP